MDVPHAAATIDHDLRAEAVAGRAEKERAYLKSDLTHYGVSVPAIRRVAVGFLRTHDDLRRDDLLALVDALWSVPVHERRMAAVELLAHRPELLGAADLGLLERLLREARTWALVDPLAVAVLGPIVRTHPGALTTLDRWSRDGDHWLRRAVLLAFLVPLRRGDPDAFPTFSRYADAMLEEREFFIRKAIGWALRERAKSRPEEVFAWLRERRERAAGLTLREASKRLTPAQRTELLTDLPERRLGTSRPKDR
jgi:3-methyladenine DNA glycosylase AlkD